MNHSWKGTEALKCESKASYGWADIGDRPHMEDTHICIDNFSEKFGCSPLGNGPWALYGVSGVFLDNLF